MALLGQSINPALFVQDYSGFTKAAAIQAQGMQNLGQQIQGIAQDYTANKKEESKLSAVKKAGIADIQAAIQLSKSSGLGLESTLEPLLAAATDPNSSLIEQATAAQQASQTIGTTMNTKFKIEELNMQRQAASRAGAVDAARIQAIADEKNQRDALSNAIGNPLFQSVVSQLPTEMSKSILASSENLTPSQKFDLANSLTQFVPKSKTITAPEVKTFKTPQGEIQLQHDEYIGKWIPIQAAGIDGQVGVAPTTPLPLVNPPAGYESYRTESGGIGVRPLEGSPDYIKQQQAIAAEEGMKQQRAISGATVIQDASRALGELQNINQGTGVIASNARKLASGVAGTPEYKILNTYVPTIVANITFDKLQELRQNSPSNASGLGALNKGEADALRDSAGKLTDISDPVIFAENLIRVQSKFIDAVHGTSVQRQKLVDSGKLSRSENLKIESLYPDVQMSSSGQMIQRNSNQPNIFTPSQEVQSILDQYK
jgi:hypothetical protein